MNQKSTIPSRWPSRLNRNYLFKTKYARIVLILALLVSTNFSFGQINLTENFDASTSLPAGWTASGFFASAVNSCSGNSVRKNLWSLSTNGSLTTPMQNSNGGQLTVSFDYNQRDYSGSAATPTGSATLDIQVSYDGTNFSTVASIPSGDLQGDTNMCFNLTAPVFPANAGNCWIRFDANWVSGDFYLYLDNINITQGPPPACAGPTVSSGSYTSSGAVISWIDNNTAPANSFNLEYGPAGFVPGTGNLVTGLTGSSYTLSGLMPNTFYDVYMTADCGSATSLSSAAHNFKTNCVPYSAPFTYDVESAAATTNATIADCWSTTPTGTTSQFRWDVDASGSTPSSSTGPSGANSGTKYFYTEASSGSTGDTAILYSNQYDVSNLNIPYLSFYYHMFGAAMGELHAEIWDGTQWVNVLSYIGQQQAAQTDPFLKGGASIAGILGTTTVTQIRFIAVIGTSFTSDMAIDDISIEEAPNCLPASNITAFNISHNAAQVSFVDTNNSSPNYIVEYGPSGFTQGTGVSVMGQAGPIPLTGLTASTTFDYYFNIDCGGGDSSGWVGPFSFTTPCAPITTFPALETFDSWLGTTSLPLCWQEGQNGNNSTGPTVVGSGDWIPDDWSNTTSNPDNAARINIFSSADRDWLISPYYTLPSTPVLNLIYDVQAMDFGQSVLTDAWESDDSVLVLASTNGTTWTEIFSYNDQNVPAAPGYTEYIDLSAYAGQTVQFAFVSIEGNVNGSSDIDFMVNNFQIAAPPSCFPASQPMVSNLTPSGTALVSWVDSLNTSPLGYMITYTNTGSGVTDTAMANMIPHSLSGLMGNVNYDLNIYVLCSATDTSGPVTTSFVTPCNTITAPFVYDVESAAATTSSVIADCWSSDPTNTSSAFRWNVDASGSTPSSSTGPSGANSGTNYFYTEASNGVDGDTAILTSPYVDVSALTTPYLEFDYHMFGATMGNLYVEVWNGSAYVAVDSLVGQQQNALTVPWMTYGIDISSVAASTTQVRFVATKGSSFTGDISIDDISITEAAPCLPPTNVQVVSTTSTGITLSWTAPAGTSNFNYVVVAQGTSYSGTAIDSGSTTTNSVVISNVPAGASYDVFIQSDCVSDSSTFTKAVVITPLCSETLPYFQDFEAGGLPPCWAKENTNGDSWTWGAANQVPCNGLLSMRLDQNTTGHDDWVFSPYFSVTAGNTYRVSFWFKSSDSTLTQKLTMYASEGQNSTDALAGDLLFEDLNVHNDTCALVTINYVPTTTGEVTFAFLANAAGSQGHIGFDDFKVYVPSPNNIDTIMAMGNDNNCYNPIAYGVAGNMWHDVRDAQGRILLSINPNGNSLGNVSVDFMDRSVVQTWVAVNQTGNYKIVPRSWAITPENQPTTPVDLKFYVLGEELDAFNASAAGTNGPTALTNTDLFLTKQETTAPDCDITNGGPGVLVPFTATNLTTTSTSGTNDFYVEASVASFSEFALHESSNMAPLSITFENFRGTINNNVVDLSWNAEGIQEGDIIHLEKYLDGQWTEIAQVEYNKDNDYHYADNRPILDNIYRLRSEEDYSSTLKVRYITESSISIYPNPVTDNRVTVSIGASLGEYANFVVYDALGRQVLKEVISLGNQANIAEISLVTLPAGNYFLEVTNDNASQLYNGVLQVK